MRLTRKPHEWTARAKDFGRGARINWKAAAGPVEQIELGAAQIQHAIVVRAFVQMAYLGIKRPALADASGVDASTLGKLLRGERTMNLLHIAALEHVLGELRPPARA